MAVQVPVRDSSSLNVNFRILRFIIKSPLKVTLSGLFFCNRFFMDYTDDGYYGQHGLELCALKLIV